MQSSWILQGRARLGAPDPARRRPLGPPTALTEPGPAAGRSAPVDLPRRRQEQQRRGRRPRGLPLRLDQRRAGALQPRQPRRCERQALATRPRGAGAAVPDGRAVARRRHAHRRRAARRTGRRHRQQRQRAAARTLAQLAWLGLDAATIAARPYATLLPTRTPVNANTAARVSARRRDQGLDLATAERLVQLRQRDPFKTPPGRGDADPGLAR